jgi:hypothetical protein
VTALLATINASGVPIRFLSLFQRVGEFRDGPVSVFPDRLSEKSRHPFCPPARAGRAARRAFGAVR